MQGDDASARFDSGRGHVCEEKPVKKDCRCWDCTKSDAYIPPIDRIPDQRKK